LNRLLFHLGILARKVSRSSPLDVTVVAQAAFERLDHRFPFRRHFPVELRRAAVRAGPSQKEAGVLGLDHLLRSWSPPNAPSYRLRPLLLNRNASRHTRNLPPGGSLFGASRRL